MTKIPELLIEYHYDDGGVGIHSYYTTLWDEFTDPSHASHIIIRPDTGEGQRVSNFLLVAAGMIAGPVNMPILRQLCADLKIWRTSADTWREPASAMVEHVHSMLDQALGVTDNQKPCEGCDDKRYRVANRHEDNLMAIERCDLCCSDEFTDEDAANLARRDGIRCAETYPCYLYTMYVPEEDGAACAQCGWPGIERAEEDRCSHGMFYSGAGACPQCGGGAE